MLRYFVEKSDQSYEKALEIQERIDRYLGKDSSFLVFPENNLPKSLRRAKLTAGKCFAQTGGVKL